MTDEKRKLILDFREELARLTQQRRMWLVFSGLLIIGTLTIGFTWNVLATLNSELVWWIVGIAGVVITINWWYWTMIMVRRIICHQYDMLDILSEITNDIGIIKNDIQELNPNKLF